MQCRNRIIIGNVDMQAFDLIVIGSGAAGSVAARTCRSAGWAVAVVDSLPFGGTCALRGCDPKKVLVGAADLLDWSRRMNEKRTVKGDLEIDWPELMRFKHTFTDPAPKQAEQSFEQAGIKCFHGRAKFIDHKAIEIEGEKLEARYFLIATGATPASLKIPGEDYLIDSTRFMELEQLPNDIVFVGGGFIAMEFAHVAVRAGSRVTVLHRGDRVLEGFDPDLVSTLAGATTTLGVSIHTATSVEAIEKAANGRLTVLAKHHGVSVSFECDLAVHAAGRIPDLDELELDAAGVSTEKRGVAVNEYLQSITNPAVYAGGDAAATDGLPLTPVAGYDGKLIAANLLDGNHLQAEYHLIPSVVFTIPPLASVGLSEQAATQQGLHFRKNMMDTGGWYSSRRVADKTSAFKVLIEEGSERILGAHLLGPAAEETINLFTLAMRFDINAEQLKQVLFAYPSHASDMKYML
ncbi:similar to glutathione reductase [Sulfuriferula multivorans]|uniref:Similar to glutathione reductase n=2 Tax=Sulfuriferula multivorans TaxID=1559896 RepID=A0A401JD75_9PROT|nr:similar to glutathione reductase [Sulfuriferula multivorans]